MDVGIMQFPPGDSRMIDKIVHQLKSQGIFDQFRKECIADVDTKPAYQNLHQRVESTVSGFLANQVWRPDMNKNQLRDSLRKHIHESGFLDIGVERIVDQVVNPKIKTVFMPQVEDVVYSYLGIDRPKKGKENANVHVAPLTIENLARKEQKKLPTLTDLLPKELEPISPASDTKCIDTSFEEGEVREDNGVSESKEADNEEASPPFEPITEVSTREETSMDSHLSGISELTSHGSQHSPIPPATAITTTGTHLDNSASKVHTLDFANNDSQLSRVSSGSRLSIVSFIETDNDQPKVLPDAEANEESQQSRMSPHMSSQDTQHSVSMDAYTPTKACEYGQDDKMSPMHCLNIDENSVGNRSVVENLNENKEHELQDQTDRGKFSDASEIELKGETPYDHENIPVDRATEAPEENNEITVKKENGISDKEFSTFVHKSEHKVEMDSYEQEDTPEEREYEQNIREMELSEEYGKNEENSDKKTVGGMDTKFEFETEKKQEEKQEKVQDYTLEKRAENKQQKADDKSEKKQEERLEKKSDKRLEEKYGKKHDEKPDRKSENKNENHKDKSDRYEERSDKRANEKSEKKADDKQEKRYDEKCDKKVDSRSDRKLDDRKSEKSKDRERSRDKRDEKRKESAGNSKDLKRSESSGHLDGEKRRTDKDRHKKERSESRNRSEKSSKHDSREGKEKDGKEKQKYDEKSDREAVKGKHKQERDAKEDKRIEEKERKVEKESYKEKVRKEDSNSFKPDKDSKKKDKERNKSDEKQRSKHDDRHKDRTKSTENKSDKEKSRDEKNSKDGSKSSGKETKDQTKQDSKERVKSDAKDTTVKYDEKRNKDRKYDDKDGKDKSGRSSDKGNSKTPEKRKDDSESSKSSRSEHKNKDGRKSKDSKSKGASDDHRIHREKHSEDRRSTDRDSNGTAQDRAVGNLSRTNGNDSQRSHSHRTKTNENNSNSKSDNRGSSECAETIDEAAKDNEIQSPVANSPPSSLPFKKRPYSEHAEIKEYQSSISSAGKLVLKSKKKPKIAANIFEVKKIMQLRKSIAKKERKQQKKLRKLNKEKTHEEHEVQEVKKLVAPDEVKRVKLGELENSLRKEVKKSLTNRELMPTNNEKEADIKYFALEVGSEWVSKKDADFLAFLKQLEKSETLSELSTDTEDEVEEQVHHKISIPYELLEPLVADEIGAKLVRSDGKVHIVMDHAVSLKSHNMHNASPSASEAPKCMQSDSLKAEGGNVPITCNEHNNMNFKSTSVSKQSLEVISETDEQAEHLRNRPSSVNSMNSSDSCIIVEESETSKPEQHIEKNIKQRRISGRRPSGKSQDIQEAKSSQDEKDKKERRRPLRPSTRYPSKEYASACMTTEGHLQQGSQEGYDALLYEVAPEVKPIPSVSQQTPSKSKMDNSTTKKVPKRSLAPSGLHKTRAARTLSAFVSDTEDESPVSNDTYSFETGYCVIKDNNNVDKDIDKDLSEDEKGNDIPLNQELILSTLQDLMIESGYHKPDIPTNIIRTVRGTSLDSQSHNEESTETKRPKLGRSRRVGLGKPLKTSGNQTGNDNGGSRTATPPTADFVMPLSPESDVSASSGDARKGALDTKVTDGPLNPSPSNSDGKSNPEVGDGENRRTLRSSGAQRYTSDDLYKPRPLFTPGSRRSRNRPSSPIEETVTSCAMKRPAASMDVADTPPSSKRRR